MWVNVRDKLPEHGKPVFVKIGDVVGVAEYIKHFGFEADSSAYEIYCLDDSGLKVSLSGPVTEWMEIPT